MTANVFKAGYLPGLNEADVTYQRLQLGTTQAPMWVDVPHLSVEQMTALAARVRHASQTDFLQG